MTPEQQTADQQTPSSSETSNALETYKTKPIEDWTDEDYDAYVSAPRPEELIIKRSVLNILKQNGYSTSSEVLHKGRKKVTIIEDEPELTEEEAHFRDWHPDDDEDDEENEEEE